MQTQKFVPSSTYPLIIYRMPQHFKSMNLYQTVRGKRPYWFITVCPRPAPQQCSKLCQSWASSRGSPSKEITSTHRTQWPQARKLYNRTHQAMLYYVMCCKKGFRVCQVVDSQYITQTWSYVFWCGICLFTVSLGMSMIYQVNIHLGARVCCVHSNWASRWKAPALRTSHVLCWHQELPQRWEHSGTQLVQLCAPSHQKVWIWVLLPSIRQEVGKCHVQSTRKGEIKRLCSPVP